MFEKFEICFLLINYIFKNICALFFKYFNNILYNHFLFILYYIY